MILLQDVRISTTVECWVEGDVARLFFIVFSLSSFVVLIVIFV